MANILVTGGSRGIGAAIAKKFAEQGDTVYITYCKSKEAAQALEQQYGIHPIFADFGEDFGALKAGKAIAEQIGTIDTLVNNAAISVVDVFQCVSEEDCTALYRVNLFGTVDMTRAILPTMLQQHAGNIINITSVWGQTGASCEVDYSVTKGGIIAFTKALAKEVAPSGIRVNAVSPGVIDTEMNAHLSEEDRKELAEETPLQRIGKPEEIADAVLFLASERAAFITGQILPVNGGFFI
ncbi:MAG: 3-oxoacyl-ACP reductase FabG [Ruminococcus sp.]|nr:3-oxoacyl-ACP reductase FabG [Ruminococcus sp.]